MISTFGSIVVNFRNRFIKLIIKLLFHKYFIPLKSEKRERENDRAIERVSERENRENLSKNDAQMFQTNGNHAPKIC